MNQERIMPEAASIAKRILIRDKLLRWFDHHQRDLPWRGETDPYRIWVSEVMLQQTQVSTVLPYYARFLERFPTLRDLAAASLDDVLKAWEGLGYYARARNFHAAARRIVADHGGKIPDNYSALRRLPGLGEYAAGAVASIAFGEAVPAVDGNVKRVTARLFAITENIEQSSVARRLRAAAADLVPADRPGDFNQALMELGATTCTPTRPGCRQCPLKEECQALASGLQETLPTRTKREPLPHHDMTAAVIHHPGNGRLLVAQRNTNSMLGGLWEFPGGRCQAAESLPDCLSRSVVEKLGVQIEVGPQLTTIQHSYTHFRITLHIFECHYLNGKPRALDCADWRWISPNEIPDLALAVTDRKIAKLLRSEDDPQS